MLQEICAVLTKQILHTHTKKIEGVRKKVHANFKLKYARLAGPEEASRIRSCDAKSLPPYCTDNLTAVM